MMTGFLHLHSVLRYLIVIVAIWAIVAAFMGKSSGKQFVKKDKTPGLVFMIMMDLQLIIGLVLYFFKPGSGFEILKNNAMSSIMKNDYMRFFAIEHLVGMLLAFILVHIGYATSKKNISDGKKFSKMGWLFLIAFLLILATVPWPFRDLGKGWMPG